MESAGNLQSLFISVPNSSLHFQFQHLDGIYVFVVVLQDPTLSAYMFFKSEAACRIVNLAFEFWNLRLNS